MGFSAILPLNLMGNRSSQKPVPQTEIDLAAESTLWEQLSLDDNTTAEEGWIRLPASHVSRYAPRHHPQNAAVVMPVAPKKPAPRVNLLRNRHRPVKPVCLKTERMLPAARPVVHEEHFVIPRLQPKIRQAEPQKTHVRQPIAHKKSVSGSKTPSPHRTGNPVFPVAMRAMGMMLTALAIGGLIRPMLPTIQAETAYQTEKIKAAIAKKDTAAKALPASVPKVFDPLIAPDGSAITPVDTDFGVVVPKLGINASVIPDVDPSDPKDYDEALLHGVAHSSTSFFPNENGTVYLFSHSTNYEWFVKDLNAVFYLLKNLDTKDVVVLLYKGKRYTYQVTEKRVVKPTEISYLLPTPGKKQLILQTCWPPGSTTERLLIFADLIEDGTVLSK